MPRFQVIIPFRARPSYCVEIKGGDPRTAGKGLKELSIASETWPRKLVDRPPGPAGVQSPKWQIKFKLKDPNYTNTTELGICCWKTHLTLESEKCDDFQKVYMGIFWLITSQKKMSKADNHWVKISGSRTWAWIRIPGGIVKQRFLQLPDILIH